MLTTTVGRLMVNEALPPELRDYDRVLDKKALQTLMQAVQERYPDRYKEVVHALSKVGGDVAYYSGTSLSLKDLEPSKAREPVLADIRSFVAKLHADQSLDDETRNKKLIEFLATKLDPLRDTTYAESLADRNNFAMAIKSGARGNAANLSTLRAADLLVADQHDRPIPVAIMHNYSEGLSPGEYFATSYGTRKGIISTKLCLAAGTGVRMADESVRSIEDVRIGDVVLGSNLDGCVSPVEVTNVFSNGNRDCYRFVFVTENDDSKSELEIVCTEEHKILATVSRVHRAGQCATVMHNVVALKEFVAQPESCSNSFVACLALPATVSSVVSSTARLVSREYVGHLPTYDIEVDSASHLFVLHNGLVVSNSTAEAGYLGKLLANAAARLLVTNDTPLPDTGLPVSTDDNDSVGAVLARDYGSFKAGTVITPSVLKAIRATEDEILVHSPISAGGIGIPKLAAGVRERGMAAVGDNVGIAAAQAISEPLSQSQLSAKHGAGVIGSSNETSVSGFKAIEQLTSIPSTFRGAAALAKTDGRVMSITPAPQGGQYITIGTEQHYVAPTAGLKVKPGDEVEAGDMLSTGIPNPAEIVRYKHVGEGRRYFMEALRDTLRANGINTNRRNIEIMARGLINHVRMTDFSDNDDTIPDDVVSYDELAARWKPRAGARVDKPERSVGRFLETPVLHYSIGTRITPRVVSTLRKHRVATVNAHNDPPAFEPYMARALESTMHDKDWFKRLQGFYVGRGFMDAARRGSTSEIHGTNFGHALAASPDFGKDLSTRAVY